MKVERKWWFWVLRILMIGWSPAAVLVVVDEVFKLGDRGFPFAVVAIGIGLLSVVLAGALVIFLIAAELRTK
jgi:hypothetical protein